MLRKRFVLVCKQGSRKVAVAGVRQQHNDGFTLVFRAFGKLHCGPCCCTRRNTNQHSLGFANQLACCKGIFVGNRDNFVINLRVQYFGYKTGSDSLDFMLDRGAFGKYGRGFRFHGDNLDVGVERLQ